jgi:hypothetical protein
LRVQELAERIKEAGWPGDPVRFAAALVDEITDPAHGVATSEQVAHHSALLREELHAEIKLVREEMRAMETRLELRIERGLRQWGLPIVAWWA